MATLLFLVSVSLRELGETPCAEGQRGVLVGGGGGGTKRNGRFPGTSPRRHCMSEKTALSRKFGSDSLIPHTVFLTSRVYEVVIVSKQGRGHGRRREGERTADVSLTMFDFNDGLPSRSVIDTFNFFRLAQLSTLLLVEWRALEKSSLQNPQVWRNARPFFDGYGKKAHL